MIKLSIDPEWMCNNRVVFPIKKIIADNFDSEYSSVGSIFDKLTNDDIVFLKLLLDQSLEESAFAQKSGRLNDGYVATFNISVLAAVVLLREGVSAVSHDDISKVRARLYLILTLEANKALGKLNHLTLLRNNYTLTEENPKLFAQANED